MAASLRTVRNAQSEKFIIFFLISLLDTEREIQRGKEDKEGQGQTFVGLLHHS